ncbi:MAG: SH3 domain-containing protein [Nitrosomonas sp.]|jgi:SH3-like domain-containing protein|uniref:SH3 domain-containing protein n=2 Tax=Nitrosomonas sp. TaxID=42353 RepID=UPI002732D9C2|nr:SH3 domain-containing protein [Nitrosomonas sp.]MDP3662912.1 SH3 domain-containing protein [Nitrosomonas sp.]MDZ4105215.1 SH3 domain-containing protein [Nitrosomonas sp.]
MRKSLPIKSFWLKNSMRVLLGSVLLYLHGFVAAEMEFFSLAENAVVMYDAPSLRADKLYVASRYLPVEVVVDVDGWAKVRDSSGSLAWVEKKVLSQQRYVVVTVPLANIHQSADMNSELVFQAEENIVMEWIGSEVKGWVKVRHLDGQTGFVKVNQVWGS